MAVVQRATVRVNKLPYTAIAQELHDYFESTVGSVYACEIAAAHCNWKSRGFGRVQFESSQSAERALAAADLPPFQGVHLAVGRSLDDLVPRAGDGRYRIAAGVLRVGVMAGEREMEVLQKWEPVAVEVVHERRRVVLLVEDGGEMYKLELGFDDIVDSFGCLVDGISMGEEEEDNAILLRFKFAPRLYKRITSPGLKFRFRSERYFLCKDDLQFVWVRTSDFSSSYSIGRSCVFCLEVVDGPSVSDIIRSLPYSQHLGDLILRNEGSPPPLAKVVPLFYCPDRTVSYEILFQLNSLVHMQKISPAQVNSELLNILSNLSLETAMKILRKLHDWKSVGKTTCYDPVGFINSQKYNLMKQKTLSKSTQKENLMSCHRVLVTPLKVYFLGPELESSNYVVKNYSAYASDFLRVSFVDEDWTKLPSDALSVEINQAIFSKPYRTDIYTRILTILRDGICIGSKKFEFLAFSASQLRGNSVWMFASNDLLTAEDIRKWMGEFNKIHSISKCAARMGQLFSSSRQTFDVLPREVQIIPDVEMTIDGVKYCFSDGIGKISLAFARQIAKQCGLKEAPSAFQIRYGGYKGVVAVDRTSFKKLSLRASMKKFDSKNTMLNIAKWSECLPCYLNREIISLLSTLGIEDEIFELMQQRHMYHLGEMLTNRCAAVAELGRMAGSEMRTALKLLMNGYNPNADPYIAMMIRSYHDHQLSDLKSRCRIFVPKGRVLLGCLDETGILKYGQVYIRITLNEEELRDKDQTFFHQFYDNTAAIVGKVVVTRNPCLHPGDIRVLQAVCEPQVDDRGLVDCVVFPQTGERPHPNECSGGDLDGDLYFVCWDDNLIPLKTDTPMDYIGGRQRHMGHEVTLQEIQKFFVDYMINDTLGVISNAHLVHADREPNKARSPQCLELAKLHSMAVDFAKTGAPAAMPIYLRPKELPDFMERPERQMYISNGVLGKLYRAVSGEARHTNPESKVFPGDIYDPDFEVDGFENLLGDALKYREEYSERMRSLMNYYGVEHEDEILTGNLRSKPIYLQRDKNKSGEIKDRMLISLKSLHKEFDDLFRCCCPDTDLAKMASAWYRVTYHPDYYSTTNFLSFPWIVVDVLLNIRSMKRLRR